MIKHQKKWALCIVLSICFFIYGCSQTANTSEIILEPNKTTTQEISITACENTAYPAYSGDAYAVINSDIPFFTEDELTSQSYESYSNLDELGRPGIATACLGPETMPLETEERGQIGMIKPAGWHTIKYPNLISDLYLYNRCHLIGWQLSGENANELNLITGTRYLNITGMLQFENKIADYIKNTKNHVMYRVTPIYENNNLICNGLLMETQSIEDDKLSFCVYCYNVQPGIIIDYATGDSEPDKKVTNQNTETEITSDDDYVLNTKSLKIHTPDCPSAEKITNQNRQDYHGNINDLLTDGYTTCKQCNPE